MKIKPVPLTARNRDLIARGDVYFPDRGSVYRAKCCGALIQSLWVHDFVFCPCGGASVDGGGAYLHSSGDLELVK